MFEAITYSDLGYGLDVAPSTISLGEGWRDLEFDGSEQFRRIDENARALFASAGRVYAMTIDVEPAQPAPSQLVFEVRMDGIVHYEQALIGRTLVRFVIPPGEAAMRRIAMKTTGGGVRIFRCAALPHARDVVPQWLGFRVGAGGWYQLEDVDGTAFRHVNRQAEIVVGRPAKSLEFEVEPGPGVAYAPMDLDISIGDRLLRRVRVEQRMRLAVELPELRTFPARLVLSCQGGGRPAPPDARLMDFRLLSIPAPWERSELLRSLAALGPS
jgi:hypothetical protein